jgi:hypothetical protein
MRSTERVFDGFIKIGEFLQSVTFYFLSPDRIQAKESGLFDTGNACCSRKHCCYCGECASGDRKNKEAAAFLDPPVSLDKEHSVNW